MKQHIIVTGANGYLGSYICRELLRQGYAVIGFRYDHWASVIIDDPDIEYIHCDITKAVLPQQGIRQMLEGKKIEAIVNAAALLGSSDYDKNLAVNAHGVENMIAFAKEIGINRFIQVSSVVVLKAVKGPYGETKLEGQVAVESSDLDYTVFIPAMILGPESLGLNRILKNMYRFPLFVPLVGKGSQTQHPIFVKDFARYIVRCIPADKAFRKTYQIAGESVIPFRDLISLILEVRMNKKIFIPVPPRLVSLMGRFFQAVQKVPVFTAEHVKGVLQDSKLDTGSLKDDLDFEPTPLKKAMEYSLARIGKNWNYYLSPREEITISKED